MPLDTNILSRCTTAVLFLLACLLPKLQTLVSIKLCFHYFVPNSLSFERDGCFLPEKGCPELTPVLFLTSMSSRWLADLLRRQSSLLSQAIPQLRDSGVAQLVGASPGPGLSPALHEPDMGFMPVTTALRGRKVRSSTSSSVT